MEKLTDEVRTKLERLYRERGRELWARLYAVCLDADLAMDALHEAFARFAPAAQNGALRNPAAWLYKTARNWLLDQRRGERRVQPGRLRLAEPNDPSSEVLRSELHETVRDALASLSEADRELLVLRYALGWPSKRIGSLLGISPAAVDMRLSRARDRLAERLRQRGVHDGTAR